MHRAADLVFWLSTSLWLAFALAGGLAAMAIFPVARELPLGLEGLEAFVASNPEQARLMIAGHLVERVFLLSDGVRLVLAAVTALALLGQLALAPRGAAGGFPRLRLAATTVAAGALLVGALWVQPEFSERDRTYRAAARSGDIVQANELKVGVDAAHATASRAATTEVGAILVLIALSAVGGGRASGGGGSWRSPFGFTGSRRG
jgi:hypothetical protein